MVFPAQMANQNPPDLIGQSKIFLDALEHASKIAMIDRPIFIAGERGSGKSLLATRIHFLSTRWEGPLIRVNCAESIDNRLETELFGQEASLSGAGKRHMGKVERAQGGTLFLDEVAAAPLHIQERLLRLIETGEYERIGGTETLNADIRIIAASAEDLRQRAFEGGFHRDLLDQVALDVVAVPPLRERQDDIALLAAHFASPAAAELGLKFPGFSAEAAIALNAHDWPGNVRELRSVVERAVFRWGEGDADGYITEITVDPFERDFGAFTARKSAPSRRSVTPLSESAISAVSDGYQEGADLRAYLSELEKTIVAETLARNGDNQRRAAEALCLTYDQIRGIVKKHNL